MAFTQYRTIEGDRWDTIAYKAYGDATQYMPIVQANKPLSITSILPAGIELNIPIIEEEDSPTGELLPPWLRTENE